MTTYTVRNNETDVTTGWAARAMQMGMKVLSRPGKFGNEEYIVKQGGAAVSLTQNSRNGRKLDAAEFTPAQHAIVQNLRMCGLIA